MPIEPDRFSRQAELVPRDKLVAMGATVIGVGAIGRQVALQLAAIGAPHVKLIDFDTVELTNVSSQGYDYEHVGQTKVQATAKSLLRINPAILVEPLCDRYRPQHLLSPAVFCCVDSIVTRASIWRRVGPQCQFWADGRMLGESLRVLTASDADSRQHYATTLFAAAEAQRGTCTSQSTIYAASIAAGLMLQQFTRWLRHLPLDQDLTFNLLASELSVG